MSLTRAALRLPRVGTSLLESRIPRTSLAVVNQRRWLRKPPPRDRAWAERKEEDDRNRRDLESTQQSAGLTPPNQQPEQQGPGLNTQLASTYQQTQMASCRRITLRLRFLGTAVLSFRDR
jgi:hypothetical protein